MEPLDNVTNVVITPSQLLDSVIDAVASPSQLLDNVIDAVVSPTQRLDNVIDAVVSPTQLLDNVLDAVASPTQLLDNVIDAVVSPKPPVLEKEVRSCLICDDKATGFHYGVLTCEGCKKFFGRAFNKEYKCRYNTPCPITVRTRNDCKGCRLKKCREVGMHKEQRQPLKPVNNRPQPIDAGQQEKLQRIFQEVRQSHAPDSLQPVNNRPEPMDPIQQDDLEFERTSHENRQLHTPDSLQQPVNNRPQPIAQIQQYNLELGRISHENRQLHTADYLQPANIRQQPIEPIQQDRLDHGRIPQEIRRMPEQFDPIQQAKLEFRRIPQERIDPIQQDRLHCGMYSQDICRLHTPTYAYSNDKMMMMTIEDFEPEDNTETLQYFIYEINADITSFLSVLKSVSILKEMTIEDKSILLKRHAFSIYFVRSVPACTDDGFLFKTGDRIPWMKVYDVYKDLGVKMNIIATEIREMYFTEAELGLFVMLIMLQPIPMEDVLWTGFEDVQLLIEAYALVSRALNYHLSMRDREERLFEKIPELVKEVNAINDLHEEIVELIKKTVISFSIPQLFFDVFGVPQTVVDHLPTLNDVIAYVRSTDVLNARVLY